MNIIADIPLDEWAEVARRVLPFVAADEAGWSGNVVLTSDGDHRTWTGTDSYKLASLHGGSDSGSYALLLPERAIGAALRFGWSGGESVTVAVTDATPESSAELVIIGQGGTLRLPLAPPPPESPQLLIEREMASQRVSTVIGRVALTAAVSAGRIAPLNALEDGRESPLFHFSIEPTEVSVFVGWEDYGYTKVQLVAASDGTASVAVNPRFLGDLLEAADDDEITLSVPASPHSAVALSSPRWLALLMPIDTTIEIHRARVEQELARVFGADVVHRDPDGDYCLSTRGVPVYARLQPSSPPSLQIFAVALQHVEPTIELLNEINDQNTRLQFVRMMVTDGQVLVEADLVASTVDAPEIETSFDRVRTVANDLAPMMAMAFGGVVTEASEERRWSAYLETVIRVELLPGSSTTLTGTDATGNWPFDEPVHVITAANPFGRRIPEGDNDIALGELASALTQSGVGYARASGKAADGGWGETSFLVWGLTTEAAIEIGRRFGQEAIFELTAAQTCVVECFGDGVRVVPRRPGDE